MYFVLTHPVYKMEFEYNKDLINTLLKKYPLIEVSQLKFFVTNKREKKKLKRKKNLSLLSVLMEFSQTILLMKNYEQK